jgi:hypothetical protein
MSEYVTLGLGDVAEVMIPWLSLLSGRANSRLAWEIHATQALSFTS